MLRSLALMLVLTTAAHADTAITSKTTDLYPSKACKEKGKAGEGQDPALRCPALPGYVVDVWFSAMDTHVEISGKGKPVQFGGQVGGKLEWRLAGGKPFAVIVAVTEVEDDDKGQPHIRKKKLLIRGLDGFASTLSDELEDKDASSIKKARELADAAYRKVNAPKK